MLTQQELANGTKRLLSIDVTADSTGSATLEFGVFRIEYGEKAYETQWGNMTGPYIDPCLPAGAGAAAAQSCGPPSLTCGPGDGILGGPVVRGDSATCRINGTVDSVAGWEFEGLLPKGLLVVVPSASTDTIWSGTAVAAGKVSAIVIANGVTDTLTDTLKVTRRPWSWDPASHWDFKADTILPAGTPDSACGYYPNYAPYPGQLALNSRQSHCASTGILDPDITINPDSGYISAEVQDSGPNGGIWYVEAVQYRIERASSLNPYLRQGKSDTLQQGALTQQCRKALGIGKNQPNIVNFYDYNTKCEKLGLDTTMFPALLNHEGYGTLGPTNVAANGHQARIELAASDTVNDPFLGLEPMLDADSSNLAIQVGIAVYDIEGRLIAGADNNHVYVHSNWSDPLCAAWFYDPTNYYNNRSPEFVGIPLWYPGTRCRI